MIDKKVVKQVTDIFIEYLGNNYEELGGEESLMRNLMDNIRYAYDKMQKIEGNPKQLMIEVVAVFNFFIDTEGKKLIMSDEGDIAEILDRQYNNYNFLKVLLEGHL